jgi:dTDP-4-amino-4,6-dideoxygalactose transaminase
MPPQAHPHASNAKLSDLAAAGSLDRLERMVQWSTFYRMQERRILSVIEDFDIPLRPLPGQTKALSPRSHLPLVAQAEVSSDAQMNAHVVLRKYYRPLEPTPRSVTLSDGDQSNTCHFANAEALYRRIVCCPCNPELRLLSSERLAQTLKEAVQ